MNRFREAVEIIAAYTIAALLVGVMLATTACVWMLGVLAVTSPIWITILFIVGAGKALGLW